MIYVEVPKVGLMTARAAGDLPVAIGEIIGLSPQPGRIYRFDAAGKALA
jgi:multiple sugar transport system ATP-binding protein